MSGATSRRKGNVAEQEVCRALGRLGIEAITSRNARAGSQGGHDIICPDLPVALEVKDQSRDALPSWVDQAREQGDETAPGAVCHKRRGKAAAEDWFLTLTLGDFVKLVAHLRGLPHDWQEVPF
jgi:hypothetical protein